MYVRVSTNLVLGFQWQWVTQQWDKLPWKGRSSWSISGLWSGFYVREWGVGVEEVRKFRGPSMRTERG